MLAFSAPMRPEVPSVVIRQGRSKPLWHGHPWVFSEAIARTEAALQPGEEVRVLDHEGRFIGRGFASPHSQIRVRIASRADEPLDTAWFERRLREARALRARLELPSADTTAYRLVNSEGDFLPGLVVDVYGDAAVVQFATVGMKRREEVIYDLVERVVPVRTVYEASASGFAQLEGFVSEPRVVRGEVRALAPCLEHGIRLEIDPLTGQKTGYFLDQRENRARVMRLARGARVLDLYCYMGGFGLAAARGGASSVTIVDVSSRALERAAATFAANGLGPVEAVESDVFRWLEQAPAGRYDLVVCDPPKFARARKDVPAALKGYRRLNMLALAVCAPGAIFCTASCSQLVSEQELERVLAAAAKDVHRRVQVVEVAYQAADHVVPVSFPEGRYLKFFVCRVLD